MNGFGDHCEAVATKRMPEPEKKKEEIEKLLLRILPGETTLAEHEMITGHVFDMVESWWVNGNILKKR